MLGVVEDLGVVHITLDSARVLPILPILLLTLHVGLPIVVDTLRAFTSFVHDTTLDRRSHSAAWFELPDGTIASFLFQGASVGVRCRLVLINAFEVVGGRCIVTVVLVHAELGARL